MILTLGNPATNGLTIAINLDEETRPIEEAVVEAVEAMKTAGAAWRQWSLDNETDEERDRRLLAEAAQAMQEEQTRRMIAGAEQAMRKINEELGGRDS